MNGNMTASITFKVDGSGAEDVLNRITNLLGGVQSAQVGVSAGSLAMGASFAGATIAVNALEKAFSAVIGAGELVVKGLSTVVEKGFEFNRTINEATLGMSAMIAMNHDFYDENGKLLEGQDKLNAAMLRSKDVVNQLRIASFQTKATFQQLTQAYQLGIGPMLAANVPLKDTVELTKQMTVAFGAAGISLEYLGTEIRQIFGGGISGRNTPLATMLRIKNEDIQNWAKAGTIVQELTKRMESFKLLGKEVEKSWGGITTNLLHFFEAGSGAAVEPLFNRIKEGLHKAMLGAFDLEKGEISEKFQPLITSFRDLFEQVGILFEEALGKGIGALERIAAWVGENRFPLMEMFINLRGIIEQLAGLMGDFFSGLSGVPGTLGGINTQLSNMKIGIAAIRDAFKEIRAMLGAVVAYARQDYSMAWQLLKEAGLPGAGDSSAMKAYVQDATERANALVQAGLAKMGITSSSPDKSTAKAVKPPSNAEDAEKAQKLINAQKKIELDIENLILSSQERITLSEKESYEVVQLQAKVKEKILQIDATKLPEAVKAKDKKRLAEAERQGIEAIHEKYDRLREEAAEKLNDELLSLEGRGYEAQIAQLHKKYEGMRKEAVKNGADMAAIARITSAERAAIEDAGLVRIQSDVKSLYRQLEFLEREKGRALNFKEQIAGITEFGQRMGLTKKSISLVTEELKQQRSAARGWSAGIAEFTVKGTQHFQNFKTAALSIMDSITNAVSQAVTSLILKQQTLGEAMKALWASITASVVGELVKLAVQFVVTAIAAKFFGNTQADTAKKGAVASSMQAASELWATYAPIPYVGPAIAMAFIAAMQTSLAANAVAAKATVQKNDRGSIVDRPTLALIGEAGEAEVVAPERDFLSWARGMAAMGAGMAMGIHKSGAAVAKYDRMGAGYARTAGKSGRGEEVHVAFNAPVLDTSNRGMETLGKMTADAQRRHVQQRARVIRPGQYLGGL